MEGKWLPDNIFDTSTKSPFAAAANKYFWNLSWFYFTCKKSILDQVLQTLVPPSVFVNKVLSVVSFPLQKQSDRDYITQKA